MGTHFPTRLSLLCVCSLLVLALVVSATKKEEEEWIKKYGSDTTLSGKWKTVVDLEDNIPELQAFCSQCHQRAYNMSRARVTEAYVSDWLLTFPHMKIEPIRADMVMYTIQERFAPDQKIPYYYFMKGVRPDCVIYVKETKMEFRFWKQICGIGVPVKVIEDSEEEELDLPEEDYNNF